MRIFLVLLLAGGTLGDSRLGEVTTISPVPVEPLIVPASPIPAPDLVTDYVNNTQSSFSPNKTLAPQQPIDSFVRTESTLTTTTEHVKPKLTPPQPQNTENPLVQPSTSLAKTDPRFLNGFVFDYPLSSIANATSEFIKSPRMAFGKNSFLTGFGLGFLAFGLKKLLLPLFIGAQIVKSVLVALFLPTILSHIGKLVGKGLTNVASQSGSSGAHDQVAEFEFKDPAGTGGGYDADAAGSEGMASWALPSQSNAHATLAALNPGRSPGYQVGVLPAASLSKPSQTLTERFTPKLPSLHVKQHYGSFYSQDPHSDFKVFNKIPSSSHLLTHYDPFYSPLLSRLDSVFKQLGTTSEGCRERLVCDMYNNPAKFAPFSNLISAQLSRELNELRKPSSDNPEILRFFRYMKAAKDGQDGLKCDIIHNNCIAPTSLTDNASPMVTTFNDINKLVHARSL